MHDRRAGLPALLLAAALAGCGGEEPTASVPPPPPSPEPGPPVLAEAVSNCYHWPARPFSRGNYAPTTISLAGGDVAADFTLRDPEGVAYTLSELLAEKPVLLVLGSYT